MTAELPARARYGAGIALVLLTGILSPATAAAQGQTAAAPDAGATLLRENDFVAIWNVTRAPHPAATAAPRTLAADQVSVTLAAGAVRITRPDGTWTVEHEPFGFVRFEPAGTVRAVEALGVEASRAIVFQLKSASLPRWPRVADVPGQFPRAGARKLLETDRIRVWDQTWTPDVRIALHMHYVPTAAVFLEGGRLQTFEADGRPNPPFGRSRGDVLALAAPARGPARGGAGRGASRCDLDRVQARACAVERRGLVQGLIGGLALPVPHNFSLDFMKPLHYGGEHGDSESGRAQPAGQPHPTASGAGRVGIGEH